MNRPTLGRRLRSALVALTITSAAAGTSIAVAGPAGAVTNVSCSTSTVLDINGKTSNQAVQYNDFMAVHVNVNATCTDGKDYVSGNGVTTLYKSINGGSTWTVVKSGTSYDAGYLSLYGTNISNRSTLYKATYSGGTYNNGYTAWNYSASSDVIVMAMYRDTDYSWKSVRGGVRYNWKISPTASIKGLKVIFQKKTSSGWKWAKTVRASSTGHVIVTFGVGRYKMNLPSARGMVASYRQFAVSRY